MLILMCPWIGTLQVTDATVILRTYQDAVLLKGACNFCVALGRPKGVEEKYLLKHILKTTQKCWECPANFVSDCIEEEGKNAAEYKLEKFYYWKTYVS
jgi:phosphoglycerate kinase